MQNLNKFEDERGLLVPLEFSSLPFEPKRVFYVKNVPVGTWRGEHAHHSTRQILICLKGKIQVRLIDINGKKELLLNENESCFVDKMVWDSQNFLEPDSILLVLCSTEFDSSDYILDFDEFNRIICENDINQ